MRLLPGWYAEVSPITIYYPNRKLLPAKTRVFIDFVVDAFRERRLAARFDAR
jgi:DNA-binding transcriptional LysR family regulator